MQREEQKVVQSNKDWRKQSHIIIDRSEFYDGLFNISYCQNNHQYEKLKNNYKTSFRKSQHFF